MIHTTGTLVNASRSLEGDMLITLSVDDVNVSEIENMKLSIDIDKYSDPKSLRALRYFWKLCTLIAQAVRSDKDSIYIRELERYGNYADVECRAEALEGLERHFRTIDVIDELDGVLLVRCYFGLSTYTKDEMRHLLDGVVEDAKEIGIETWSKEEIDALIQNWRAKNEAE